MTKNKPRKPDTAADADYWKARCEKAERMIKALTEGKREIDMRRDGTAATADASSTVVLHNYRTYGPNLDASTIMMAHMDSIIGDAKWLHAVTGFDPEQFDYLCHMVGQWVASSGRARLFWDDEAKASRPGNRCKLYIRHFLLLSLAHKKNGRPEEEQGTIFLISQSTVNRYLKLASIALAEILPTARNLTEILQSVYRAQADQADQADQAGPVPQAAAAAASCLDQPAPQPWQILDWRTPLAADDDHTAIRTIIGPPMSEAGATPGVHPGPDLHGSAETSDNKIFILLDGTHFRILRSGDPDWRRYAYSGKKKAFTYNTNIITAPNRMILWIGKSVPGSTHDLTLLREDMPDFGFLTKAMMAATAPGGLPGENRTVIVVDKGYQGIQMLYPGAEIWMPSKSNRGSDPETGGLTQQDRDRNAEINRVRIAVEHAIGRIKQYGVMTQPYHGTPEQFNDELNVVTGLVNFHLVWDDVRTRNATLIDRLTAWRRRR